MSPSSIVYDVLEIWIVKQKNKYLAYTGWSANQSRALRFSGRWGTETCARVYKGRVVRLMPRKENEV